MVTAQDKILNFSAQDLSNTAWAVATLSYGDLPLLHVITMQTLSRRQELAPQNVSNLLWAFATLGITNEHLFDVFIERASLSEFEAQHITNIAWAYAALRVRDLPVIARIATEASRRVQHFGHVDCAISAWSLAALMVWNGPLLHAIAVRSAGQLQQFDAQNLCNFAWALASLSYADVPLLHAIAEEAVPKVLQFSPQELANTTWSFVDLSLMTQPLLDALSDAALRGASHLQGQALCSLADASLPCQGQLLLHLHAFVDKFFKAWSPTETWDAGHAARAVSSFEIDSLGLHGSRRLCDKIGIPEASPEFVLRAKSKLGERLRACQTAPPVHGWRRPRILAYAEYAFTGAQTKRGSLLFENGLRVDGWVADYRWLTPTDLPLSRWVDRALCAEAQLLNSLCQQRELVNLTGEVELYTSSPPCLSCLGLFFQFRGVFPHATLRFSCGLVRAWEAWVPL